jgi:hypothetical protein
MKKEILGIAYKEIFIFILIICTMYFNGVMCVNVHEEVHKQVFRNYGVDSTVEINYLTLAGSTSPNMTQYKKYCNESCDILNIQNEIFGYNIIVLIISLWLMVMVIVSTIIIKGKMK